MTFIEQVVELITQEENTRINELAKIFNPETLSLITEHLNNRKSTRDDEIPRGIVINDLPPAEKVVMNLIERCCTSDGVSLIGYDPELLTTKEFVNYDPRLHTCDGAENLIKGQSRVKLETLGISYKNKPIFKAVVRPITESS